MIGIPTITVPTTARLLVTIADIKEELGISDGASDSKLFRWAEATSLRFAGICNRTFFAQTVSEAFYGVCGASSLPLTHLPIISVTSITQDGTVLTTDDYLRYDDAGMIYRMSSGVRTCWYAQLVTVVYRAGYDPIPADVSDAALSIMRHKFATDGRDPMLRSFQIEGVGREDYWVPMTNGGGDLPLDLQPVADTIQRYRRIIL